MTKEKYKIKNDGLNKYQKTCNLQKFGTFFWQCLTKAKMQYYPCSPPSLPPPRISQTAPPSPFSSSTTPTSPLTITSPRLPSSMSFATTSSSSSSPFSPEGQLVGGAKLVLLTHVMNHPTVEEKILAKLMVVLTSIRGGDQRHWTSKKRRNLLLISLQYKGYYSKIYIILSNI